ncbi:type VII secretion-associated serine protease mycosin [Actinocatenispora sera]|uniref:type VII secretion-associated serine protease mycosin n=1 Tax=Actinocatenispora sera TaxID=390989 RepID=UPI0012ED8141|nr:type VII secretion-associated serine protease mycosin [Actinocatenispora sera]
MLAHSPLSLARLWRRALTAFGAAGMLALACATPVAAAPDGQWYLDALHVQQAQKISTGKGVTVAVIDSGIDNTRPALRGQVVAGKCFASAQDIEPTWDPNGHGTAMAGLIAGNGTDGRHILGIASSAKLMPLCVSGDHVTDNTLFEGITPAIRYAVDHGAKIINLSLGAYEKHADPSTVARLHTAVRYAEQHDVVLVAGAGNRGQDNEGIISPASIPGVVAVGGSSQNGGVWKGSIAAKQIALAAPAEHILTTNTGTIEDLKHGPRSTSGYQTVDGTSAATALVAGAAALVRAKYPKLDAANVINRLIKTADHKGSPGRNPQYGYGIVDPVKALTAHVDPVKTNPLGQLQAPDAGGSSSKAAAATTSTGTSSGSHVGIWIAVGAAVLAIIIVLIIGLAARSRRRKAVTAGGWQPGAQATRGPNQSTIRANAAAPSGQAPNGALNSPGRPQAVPPTGQAPPSPGVTRSIPDQTSGQQEPPEQYEIRWRKP